MLLFLNLQSRLNRRFRLYKKLVDDQKQALQTQVINLGQMDYSIFATLALPLGDVPLDTLINEIEEEISLIQTELISERSYQKLLNKFENRFFYSMYILIIQNLKS